MHLYKDHKYNKSRTEKRVGYTRQVRRIATVLWRILQTAASQLLWHILQTAASQLMRHILQTAASQLLRHILQTAASQLLRHTSVSTHWSLLWHERHLIGSAGGPECPS